MAWMGENRNVHRVLVGNLEGRRLLRKSRRKMVKVKAVPLQAWTGPEGSKEVKVPIFRDKGTGWW